MIINGITLIALVITIIVLLILAGVSIAMLTGENGILTQAQRAKNETENATANETSDLANIESLINEYQNNIDIPQVTDENPGQLEQEGTDTFIINSIEDLVFFSYDVTNGNTYEGKTVKLGVNLDFNSNKSYVNPSRTDFDKFGYIGPLKQALTSGTGFNPIGSQDLTNSFYGTFDGDNKAICSLYENINTDDRAFTGFFSSNYGEIKNLGLVSVNMTAVTRGDNVSAGAGGIVRVNRNKIINSYVTGSINVIGSSWTIAGGICGTMQEEANIENCYNLANINCENIKEDSGSANITCGGIVGQIENKEIIVNKCFNGGNINADGNFNQTIIGGICGAGNNGNIIKNCYNKAEVKGTAEAQTRISIGGIVGSSNVNLSNCYNFGNIIDVGKGQILKIGGISGDVWSNKIISNVYNIGRIVVEYGSENSIIGGVNGGAGSGNNLNNSYNIGKIEIENKDENSQKIGSISGDGLILSNCYYLTGTYDVGIGGSGSSTGVTEWDSIDKFPSVLSVVNGEGAFKEDVNNINNGYPILDWQ